LKNFAVLESVSGDYLLSPAYDLINTRLHVDDTPFALDDGLMETGFRSPGYQKTGYPEYNDFVNFGIAIGVIEKRIEKLLSQFCERQTMVETLINHSYLSESSKRGYLLGYATRRNQICK